MVGDGRTSVHFQIRELTTSFYDWIKNLQSVFKNWKEKLISGEITINDTLQLVEYPKYVLAASVYDVDIERELLKATYEEFKYYFSLLHDTLLPKHPLPGNESRLVLSF